MMQLYSEKLLDWYDRHHRMLPWRIDPPAWRAGKRPDPYKVWLSEIMLQQTTVEAVKAYFNKFIARWDTVDKLAAAPLDDILKAWAGLGYYSRARNLKACADLIVSEHGSKFPQKLDALRTLPGIGDYTAAAIAAIAFDQPVAVVDGNVERIVSRLFVIDTPLPAGKKQIREKMQIITPLTRPGDFAQSMMDLGSSLCSPKRPSCFLCPLNTLCLAIKQAEDPARFPVKAPKQQKPLRTGIAFIAQSTSGKILLQKRPETGLLAKMTQVPNIFGEGIAKDDLSSAPLEATWHYVGDMVHIFTHFRLEMSVYMATSINEQQYSDLWWVDQTDLAQEALPTVMKKAVEVVLPTAFKKR